MWSWSAVSPKATYNWVANPSFEVGSTGWTLGTGASVTASSVSFRGALCLALAPASAPASGAAASQVVSVVNTENAAYASCYIYLTSAADAAYTGIAVTTGGGTYHGYANLLLVNQWQQVSVALPSTGITYTSATITAYCSHTSVGLILWTRFRSRTGTASPPILMATPRGACGWGGLDTPPPIVPSNAAAVASSCPSQTT